MFLVLWLSYKYKVTRKPADFPERRHGYVFDDLNLFVFLNQKLNLFQSLKVHDNFIKQSMGFLNQRCKQQITLHVLKVVFLFVFCLYLLKYVRQIKI